MAKSATELKETDYVHPEVLVDTQWVADHLNDPKVKIVEVDVDTNAYDTGHLKGAIGLDWRKDLQARPIRDLLPKEELEKLLSSKGISADDTVIVYGDNNNWFAAWFVWNLKYYGHKDARLINGGRKKWQDEGRELVTDAPNIKPATYKAGQPDKSIRALRQEVLAELGKAGVALVDVRSPKEYSGDHAVSGSGARLARGCHRARCRDCARGGLVPRLPGRALPDRCRRRTAAGMELGTPGLPLGSAEADSRSARDGTGRPPMTRSVGEPVTAANSAATN